MNFTFFINVFSFRGIIWRLWAIVMMFIMYLTFTLCKVDGLSGSEVTVYLCLAYTVDGLLGIVVVILNFYTNPEVCESD